MQYYGVNNEQHLEHHGILGMKWGVRRYQNPDGSLTEAGRRKYGYNLDVNDTSRRNVAKIRVGEAKRRLDYAKLHNSSDTRKAELQGRLRTAKRVKQLAKTYDQGAALAAKGQTIRRNNAKVAIGIGLAYLGTQGMQKFLNMRKAELFVNNRWTPKHEYVKGLIENVTALGLYAGAAANVVRQANNNSKLRSFQMQRSSGLGTIKGVGSDEYASRKRVK